MSVPTITVSPSGAVAAGCTATCVYDHTFNYTHEGIVYTEEAYKVSATAAVDWTFSHFEWVRRWTNSNGGAGEVAESTTDNPYTDPNSTPYIYDHILFEGTWDYSALELGIDTWTIADLVAVFVYSPRVPTDLLVYYPSTNKLVYSTSTNKLVADY